MQHILIIDDDKAIQSIFTQLLENNGYSVETASEGREGLRKLKARTPDLIITDIMMPEMDGLEMVTYIRRNHPDLPVIAISGGMQAAPVNFLPMAKQFGACKVFEKPLALATLLEAVQELLSEKDNT
jgi:CheY-like chemotaxis protein